MMSESTKESNHVEKYFLHVIAVAFSGISAFMYTMLIFFIMTGLCFRVLVGNNALHTHLQESQYGNCTA